MNIPKKLPHTTTKAIKGSTLIRTIVVKTNEMNVPMFVLGANSEAGYESTKVYKELNINPLPHGTFISAYMKMWIATSMEYDIKEFMKKPIANEIIE